MKDPARLSGEEEWQPLPAADEPRRVDASERETGASSRLLEALKLIASIAVIIISLATMIAMFRDIPALALTAYARTADRERVLAAGFQQHVVKPVDPLQLLQLIAEVLG